MSEPETVGAVPREPNFGLTVLVVGTLALSAVTGAVAANPDHPTHSAVPHVAASQRPVATAAPTVPLTPGICPAPSEAALAATDRLFAQPTEPQMLHRTTNTPSLDILRRRTASSLGLHVFEGPGYQKSINRQADRAETFGNYRRITQNYLDLLGIKVQIGPGPEADPASVRPTPAQLNSANGRASMVSLFKAMYGVPREYVELEHFDEVRLVSGTKGLAAYATETKSHEGIIYIDLGSKPSVEEYKHEQAHLLDDALCGDIGAAANDPAFIALNPDKHQYDGRTGTFSYTRNWIWDVPPLSMDKMNALERHDDTEYCRLEQAEKDLDASVETYSNYYVADVNTGTALEDKAETGKNILEPNNYPILTDPSFKVLYGKFRLLFARLYSRSRQLADFFSRTAFHRDYRVDPDAPTC